MPNNFSVSGHLTADPTQKIIEANNLEISNFSIEDETEKDGVVCYECSCFGKEANKINTLVSSGMLGKGCKVSVYGEITINKFKDKDGNNRERVKVTVKRFDPHTWKGSEDVQMNQAVGSNDERRFTTGPPKPPEQEIQLKETF